MHPLDIFHVNSMALEGGIRGKGRRLRHDDYIYHLNATLQEKMSWRCAKRNCRARLYTNIVDLNAEDAAVNVIFQVF